MEGSNMGKGMGKIKISIKPKKASIKVKGIKPELALRAMKPMMNRAMGKRSM